MKAVVQRVGRASVTVISDEGDRSVRSIEGGLMVLLGVGPRDDKREADYLVKKITSLRIFGDREGKMNLSVKDRDGEILVVSQFTLFADTRKGNRPSFNGSAPPEKAIPLYEYFVAETERVLGKQVPTGEFGAHMEVDLLNDGPVTIMLDSESR
ncbi:MAG: D-aminoacyl-tRNA deacylase [Spirochaetales bacterium]|nr:D-aminoacyl-tRNA deacylase [Spirochaetales bacterium]